MPKYTFILTRDLTESTVIEVEATDADAAETLAFMTLRQQENTEWEIDDGSWDHDIPYVTDVT